MTKQFCKNNDLEYEVFEHSMGGGAMFGGGGGLFGGGIGGAGDGYDKKALSS